MDRINKALKDREKRLEWGLKLQRDFLKFWNLKYASKYGSLIETDKNPYDSNPDYYNKTLKVHFEIKNKWQTWDFIITKGESKVWVNKKSVNYKFEQQKNNPTEIYTVVVYFPDEGYHVAKINEIAKSKVITFGNVCGSGEPAYAVHVSKFQKFEQFINSLAQQ